MREFVADLRRPAQCPGATNKELTPKRLELLKETCLVSRAYRPRQQRGYERTSTCARSWSMRERSD